MTLKSVSMQSALCVLVTSTVVVL